MNAEYLVVEKLTRVVTMALKGQLCLCPHIRPWTRTGVCSPLLTARGRSLRGLMVATEHRKQHVGVRPARHLSNKEGIPFSSVCLLMVRPV